MATVWNRFQNLSPPLLLLLLLMAKAMQGPLFFPDSGGYVELSPQRSALYPLFLFVGKFLFGEIGLGIVIIQFLFGGVAILFFAHQLSQHLKLSYFFRAGSLLFLAIPYFVFLNIGNAILSEALAYPLFLLFLVFVLKHVSQQSVSSVLTLLGLAIALTLTRSQFLFLWPFLGVFLPYFALRSKQWRKSFGYILLVGCAFFASNLLERSYAYCVSGQFKMVPFVGRQLIVAPLYISSAEDEHAFTNENEKQFFKSVYNEMRERGVRKDDFFGKDVYVNFQDHYNVICHQIVGKFAGQYLDADLYKFDHQLVSISITLAKQHITDYVILYVQQIRIGMGGYWMTLVYIFVLLGLLLRLRWGLNKDEEFFASLFTLNFGNIALICLVEPPMQRYIFYTIMPLSLYVGLLLNKALCADKE